MNDRVPVVRLRASLGALVASLERGAAPRISENDLRAEVCAVVDDLHSLDWPPERVIIAVKQMTADAGLRPSRSIMSRTLELEGTDELLARIVRWCIEQYYHAAPMH